MQGVRRLPAITVVLLGLVLGLLVVVAPASAVEEPPAGLWEPDPATLPDAATFVHLESSPGDYVGQGQVYDYDLGYTEIFVTGDAALGLVSVQVDGFEEWDGLFLSPEGDPLEVGYYGDARRFRDASTPALNWTGEGRGCNRVSGWFVIDELTWDGATLATLRLRFQQHCEQGTSYLRGLIEYDADAPQPPPPNPRSTPDDFWSPDPRVVPDEGTYLLLTGDTTRSSELRALSEGTDGSSLSVSYADGELTFVVEAGDGGRYRGVLAAPSGHDLALGLYDDLQRYPFHNTRVGGFTFTGNGRACNQEDGAAVVDHLELDGNAVVRVRLRFVSDCIVDAGVLVHSRDGTWPTWPADTWIDGPPAYTAATDATVHLGATESGATFTCSLDGAAWSPCTSPLRLTGLGEGAHSLRARATDVDGHVDPTPARHDWTIDSRPPTVEVLEGPSGHNSADEITVVVDLDDDATLYCRFDLTVQFECPPPLRFTQVPDGPRWLELVAVDAAGNRSTTVRLDWVQFTHATTLLSYHPGPDGDGRGRWWSTDIASGRQRLLTRFGTNDGWQTHLVRQAPAGTRLLSYHPGPDANGHGRWWETNPATGRQELVALFGTNDGWQTHRTSDLDGDGFDEIASYHEATGRWWVTDVERQAQFHVTTYGTPSGWADHLTGDMDGDGVADLLSYHEASGRWWLTDLTTSPASQRLLTTYGTRRGWDAHRLGDVTGDGLPELLSFHGATGRWWMTDMSSGVARQSIVTTYERGSGRWSEHLVGDVDGDGTSDLVSLDPGTGRWFASYVRNGRGAAQQVLTTYGTATGWQSHILVGND